MAEILAKISSYNLFNYLVPGAILAFLLHSFGIYTVEGKSIVVDLVIYYFFGMVVGRIGSVIIEPILKLFRIVKFVDYGKFIDASKSDEKLAILLEVNNQYRTILAVMLVTFVAVVGRSALEKIGISADYHSAAALLAMTLLFVFAYRKQTTYIVRRVEHHAGKDREQLQDL